MSKDVVVATSFDVVPDSGFSRLSALLPIRDTTHELRIVLPGHILTFRTKRAARSEAHVGSWISGYLVDAEDCSASCEIHPPESCVTNLQQYITVATPGRVERGEEGTRNKGQTGAGAICVCGEGMNASS